MPRLAVSLLIALTFFVGFAPAHAQAHGPKLKGTEIDRATAISATTGNCVCDIRWYTVGLAPGTAKVTLQAQSCQSNLIKFCVVQAFLLRGDEQLNKASVVCRKSLKRCGLSQSMTYRVKQRGAYYLMVEGSGSLSIQYSLRIRGRVYPLHCRKYC